MSEEKARKQILDAVAQYCNTFHAPKSQQEPGERIPYASRVYDSQEMINLVDSALDFWLTSGRYARQFETDFSQYLGSRYCSLVNSGSSANLLAFMALTSPLLGERQVERGDEVITVAAGFPTTVAPIVQYGAIPVFVDVTIPQYNIDVSMLQEALSTKTKAVALAHTLGNPFNIEAVKTFCNENNLWLIEDNCDALGSEYIMDGQSSLTGTFGDIGTSSFYPPHHMTMGEGGAVYTDNPLLHKIVRSLRDWGRDCVCESGVDNICGHRFDGQHGQLPPGYDHKYVYSHFGYNLKVTDMQASVGCAQLEKLPAFVLKRRENFEYLKNALAEASNSLGFIEPERNAIPSWFGFGLQVKESAGFTRNELAAHLEKHRIQTRNLFSGNILCHPCFENLREGKDYRVVETLEDTNRIMNDFLWIGVYPGLTRQQLDYMAEVVLEMVGR